MKIWIEKKVRVGTMMICMSVPSSMTRAKGEMEEGGKGRGLGEGERKTIW